MEMLLSTIVSMLLCCIAEGLLSWMASHNAVWYMQTKGKSKRETKLTIKATKQRSYELVDVCVSMISMLRLSWHVFNQFDPINNITGNNEAKQSKRRELWFQPYLRLTFQVPKGGDPWEPWEKYVVGRGLSVVCIQDGQLLRKPANILSLCLLLLCWIPISADRTELCWYDLSHAGIYERFGRYVKTMGSGLQYFNPFTDKIHVMDMRTNIINLSRQKTLTRDNIEVDIDAAVYYNIKNPRKTFYSVSNIHKSVQELTFATLRSVCGHYVLQELL